jgi:lipopolysaccharide export system permease protein
MQFLWRYIDELVGKGLSFNIIAELMAYASASLVPMALPLAVLLSSLMTFGNMGEYYELTAMKASGISLQRIMLPVFVLDIFISIGAFFFANNVMPYTNLKMKSLLYDVRQQRPELQIREGEFYNGIDNYSIRVNKKNPVSNVLYDVKIYDHSQRRGNVSVTIADSGKMEITTDKRNLLITLWHGRSYTELEEDRRKKNNTFPHRTDIFDEQKILITLTGFGLQRTDENLFKNYYQMLNITQLSHATDSLKNEMEITNKQFHRSLLNYNYFKGVEILKRKSKLRTANVLIDTSDINSQKKKKVINDFDSLFTSYSSDIQRRILSVAISNARSTMSFIENSAANIKYEVRNLRRHEIEWHKKFTLAAACLIFLFIGAPLGAIIRKGGLGMPAVISTVFFILYYIISLTGEKIVREDIVPSYQGMWLSSLILIITGIFLTYKATNDSSMLNIDTYLSFIRRFMGIDKKTMLDRKIYLTGKFQFYEISLDELRTSLQSLSAEAAQCKQKIKDNHKSGKFVKQIFSPEKEPALQSLSQLYDTFFDKIVISQWFTINFIRDRLQEFPVLESLERFKLPEKPTYRLFVLILFPILLVYLILYAIAVHKTFKKLDVIHDKSLYLFDSLEHPSALIDFAN